MTSDPDDVAQLVAALVRDEGRRVLATLVRTCGSLQLAEDAVQDAVVVALERWPREGIPAEPRAWLTVVARNRAVDLARRESARDRREADSVALAQQREPDPGPPDDATVRDDQLRLLFTCCHPALSLDSRVALSLRTLCGLRTDEIAAALLVPEATMAKRLVRAKQKIARANIAYRVPPAAELPDRLAGVEAVIYVVFTEGHASTGGDALVRADLCDEAVRLGRLLVELMPDEDEAQGLLALMLLTDARRATRLDADGELVLLADQDRTRWNGAQVAEGMALLESAVRRGDGLAGPYTLQAAIAAQHATAPSAADTDWAEVVRLYDLLVETHDTPVTRLNRAVALAETAGPSAALAEVDAIDDLPDHHLLHAVRGELLSRLGRRDEALSAFARAASTAPSPAERRFLDRRTGALDAD